MSKPLAYLCFGKNWLIRYFLFSTITVDTSRVFMTCGDFHSQIFEIITYMGFSIFLKQNAHTNTVNLIFFVIYIKRTDIYNTSAQSERLFYYFRGYHYNKGIKR